MPLANLVSNFGLPFTLGVYMLSSAIGEFVVTFVGQVVVDFIFYFTGKVLTPLISFGRWHPASLQEKEKITFPRWGGLYTDDNGKVIVSPDGQALLGFLFFFFTIVCLVFYYQFS